ncbi:Piso0_002430 [Millerozyma farinosa CBS 7064]|uniref:Piso0_002430 protein n=1 Tax=Pichia sorbitophila (strain ATCC MYA-4447 / BCRC 22081 / CBS 7064 / NBRC 10061 / NRRL Y-12695) TaxID=559304 RepID=G8YF12_PICSO|nr:Piso0_002430 [Millerozyma farinosa CBS 7064]
MRAKVTLSDLLNPSGYQNPESFDSVKTGPTPQSLEAIREGALPLKSEDGILGDKLDNSDSVSSSTSVSTTNSNSTTATSPLSTPVGDKPSGYKVEKNILRSKINKKLLSDQRLVQIAIRRKSVGRKGSKLDMYGTNSKLHVKYLEAGLRVKFTLAPSMMSLYNSLTSHVSKRHLFPLKDSSDMLLDMYDNNARECDQQSGMNRSLPSQFIQLIDNNVVNLSGFSNKVLQTFSLNKNQEQIKTSNPALPTFNSLDTAIHTLFDIKEYTLVRITRSASVDHEGSVLLKLETARPGDYSLIDDHDFMEEMLYSIGNPDEEPNNLFIKKIVARPRYKSDMKIFLIPKKLNCSLYVDERMLERDLLNGVIDVEYPPYKNIYCTFKPDAVLEKYQKLVSISKLQDPASTNGTPYAGSNNTTPAQRPSIFTLPPKLSSGSGQPALSPPNPRESHTQFQGRTSSISGNPIPDTTRNSPILNYQRLRTSPQVNSTPIPVAHSNSPMTVTVSEVNNEGFKPHGIHSSPREENQIRGVRQDSQSPSSLRPVVAQNWNNTPISLPQPVPRKFQSGYEKQISSTSMDELLLRKLSFPSVYSSAYDKRGMDTEKGPAKGN